ncbi:YveK family protein [Bacillus niameyensis]|uniref:YveK family protein n=1 Tax=Bacillus niameyensis TaxID=1522308 RepID=UPI0007830381|nr:Wzz/FepE/Etk N-terminal domain-containing protein [Bacillus niameyensis]
MNRIHSYYSEDRRIAKEINLKELYRVIKKRYWIVLVITVLATIAGWYYSNLNKAEPLYESSTNIIIGADSEYRKTLQVIIKDTIVLETVISNLGLDKSSKSLASQINVESIDSSQVVKISVTDTNPERAAEIANMAAKVFKDEIPNILGFEEVQILSEARVNPTPINDSNPNKIIIAAFVFGIIVGIGLIFLIDSLDDSIKSERDIEMVLGIQVLGSISKINNKNVRKRKGQKTELAFRGETIGFK